MVLPAINSEKSTHKSFGTTSSELFVKPTESGVVTTPANAIIEERGVLEFAERGWQRMLFRVRDVWAV